MSQHGGKDPSQSFITTSQNTEKTNVKSCGLKKQTSRMLRSLSLMSYPVYCWQLTSPGSRSMGPGTAAAPWGNCHCTSDTAAPDTASLTAVTDSTGPCWPAGQKKRRNWEIIRHKTDKQNGSVQLVKIFFSSLFLPQTVQNKGELKEWKYFNNCWKQT